MKQRFFTGAMIIAALVLVLLTRRLTPYIFDVFMVAIAVVGCYEMSRLMAKMGLYNNMYFAVAYPVVAYAFYILGINVNMKWYLLVLVQLSLMIVFVMAQWLYNLIAYKNTQNEIQTRNLKLKVEAFSIYKAIQTLFIFLYPALLLLLFVFINQLNALQYLFNNSANYLKLIANFALILAFCMPIFTDTFAYLTGILFKGPKLCPKVSPNKTISGAIGGFVWGTLSAVALFLIFNAIPEYAEAFSNVGLAFWQFIVVGGVASVVCQLGDLFESWLKRKANVKDSGTLLPGHGGILDRMDSHMFSALIVVLFLIIVL